MADMTKEEKRKYHANHAAEWRRNNPERVAETFRLRNAKRSGFYLSKEDYDAKVRMQKGECLICGGDNGGNTLHTDHNHDTHVVRDLLCFACNAGLGQFGDDIDRLRAAADYLEDHNARL